MFTKEEAKQRVKEIVEDFEKKIEYYSNTKTDEGNIETKLLEPLFYALGWTKDDFEKREKMQRKEGRGISDYAFKLNTRTVFFLEAKKVSINIDNDKATWKQAISYALSRSVPFAVLSNFKSLKIFCVEQESALNNQFRDLKYSEFITRFDDLWLLSRESFEKNMILDMAVREQRLKKRISINSELLEDFMQSRRLLVDNIEKNYPKKYEINEKDEIIQRLLDRLIFIRKAEDIGINRDKNNKDMELLKEIAALPESKIYTKLKEIFSMYNDTYNSGLFAKGLDSDVDSISLDGHIIKNLIEHLYESRNREYFYNFDWIDADILGQVYEQYLGKILQQKKSGISSLKGGQAHKKEQGIYYTPTYIVDYIVKNTIGELLKNKKADVEKIRVLDPACGSGSFLIKAFDRLLDGYKNKHDINQKKLDMQGAYSTKTDILKRNIFGVDLDNKAVEITKLNLLLKAAEAGRKLPSEIDSHIRTGNSLIDDNSAAPNKAFKWDEKFPDIIQYDEKGNLKEGYGFDVIIGNPPYVDIKQLEPSIVRYLFSKYSTVENRMNLYSAFVERSLSLLKDGGYFGYIIPNSILYNESYMKIRSLLLRTTTLKKIIRLPDNVFENVKVETIILIYQKKRETTKNKNCEVLIYPREATIDSITHKNSQTFLFNQNIWNVDQKIINLSTNESSNSLLSKIERDTISLIELCDFSLGLTPYDKYKGHTKKQIDNRVFHATTKKDETFKPLLSGENIIRYGIFWNNGEYISYGNWLGASREKRFFTNPRIVVRQIISGKSPRIYAGYTEEEIYNAQIGFNLLVKDEHIILVKYVLALLNSKLMTFYHKEKYLDQSKNLFQKILIANAKKFPIKIISINEQKNIVQLVDKMLFLNKQLNEIGDKKTSRSKEIEAERDRIDAEIDGLVYKLYGITEEEKKIIEESLK